MGYRNVAVHALSAYFGHIAAVDLGFAFLSRGSSVWAGRLGVSDYLFPFPEEWAVMKAFFFDPVSGPGIKKTLAFIGVLVLFLTGIAGTISIMTAAVLMTDSIWRSFCFCFLFSGFLVILVAILAAIVPGQHNTEIFRNAQRVMKWTNRI